MNSLLVGLDDGQREAVLCPPTATIVHAGAGSGKTRVLTHRIAHRILTGSADGRHVLAITFTREAASEMRRRLRALGVTDGETGTPTIGTFHAVALSLLRQRLVGQGKSVPNIVHNRVALAVAAAKDHPLGQRPRELLIEIDWAHARRITPERYAAAVKREQRYVPFPATEIAELYRLYESLKRKRHVVDLDDLVSRVTDDLLDDPQYAEATRWRFRHLFVDEAQDMNPLQFAMFEALRGGREDVFIVGDPLQAIYGWNGSDHRLFDALPESIGRTTVLSLPNNYRSSANIVDAARHVAMSAMDDVRVCAIREPGTKVIVRQYDDAEDEARGIAAILRSVANRGGADPWSSSAVLVRTNAQIPAISAALKREHIPVGSNKPAPDLVAAVERAAQATSRHGLSVWATDTLLESEDEAERTVADLVNQFLHLEHPGTVDGRAFSAWITSSSTATNEVIRGVEVMTIHSAKGREWRYVIVAGFEDGLLPHRSAKTREQRAEEVRLAYVALTRAADVLAVTHASSRNGRAAKPSELLDGLPLGSTPEAPVVPVRTERTSPTLLDDLLVWRKERARRIVQSPESICSDEDLRRIVDTMPSSEEELAPIFGPLTAARVGDELLPIVARYADA
ncbi:MAG: UvrD-helicase domain-containing protein [Ilumatobacteraceae bacterium]